MKPPFMMKKSIMISKKQQLSYLIHAIAAASCTLKSFFINQIDNFGLIDSKSVIIDIKIISIF